MKAYEALPDGYKEILAVDLKENKKQMLLVNGIAIVIGVIMYFIGSAQVPIKELFSFEEGMVAYALRFAVLLLGMFVFVVSHELIHAAVMKLCGTKKVRFGFTLMYAFAGSDDYYPKWPYIAIALAPVVVLGIVIALINPLVPRSWFWVVYFFQMMNLSGAGGDLFVTFRFGALPKDILIRDYGVGMKVYSKE